MLGISNGSSINWTDLGDRGYGDIAARIRVGDFNGDGKSDLYFYASNNHELVGLSTGSSFVWTDLGDRGYGDVGSRIRVGDFDGDGRSDLYFYASNNHELVGLSTGSSFAWTDLGDRGYGDVGSLIQVGDFNGDGKSDLYFYAQNNHVLLGLSTGSSFVWADLGDRGYGDVGSRIRVGDFNGDGKSDLYFYASNYHELVGLSTGSSFVWTDLGYRGYGDVGNLIQVGDFNGDGKSDVYLYAPNNHELLGLSTGSSFNWADLGYRGYGDVGSRIRIGDFNGDGKNDTYFYASNNHDLWGLSGAVGVSDLLSGIANGLGGSTSISYTPSTQFTTNALLLFPIQTLSSITTCDKYNSTMSICEGISSTTNYTYSGGYYHIGERDFRGFHEVTATGHQGPDGEQLTTKTWYHQGNSTGVILEGATREEIKNLANVGTGYMKGKPYRTRISDSSGAVYTETETAYLADDSAPYFNPPEQVDVYTCDGKTTGACKNYSSARHIKTTYEYYAPYGNLTRINEYGDVNDGTDNRTVIRWYATNSANWIIGLLGQEVIYQGTYPGEVDPNKSVSFTNYYYDGVSDCDTASTNWTPTAGNLTRVIRWNDAVQTRMAYDPYGNLSCTRDPNGNTTTFGYDSTFTYLKTSTSPSTANLPDGLTTTTNYYGVDGVAADTGLYGQVKSVTDPNSRTTNMTYDAFGRKKKTTAPDGSWTSWDYYNFGTVGTQHIKVDTSMGLTSWTYFDGLGRTILQQKDAPGGQFTYTKTYYNATGTVNRTSVPYFDVDSLYTTFTYDALGRTTRVNNPDNTAVQACYNNGVTDSIDADQHRKRQTRDALGRLVRVEEFTGTSASCSTLGGTLYATTTYEYDVMGNLRFVTDTSGNETEMQYDTLGRKKYMKDPDMGEWYFTYYPNGSLETQKDANNKTITFFYDALNRVTYKDYPTAGTHVVTYTYDQWSSNSKGRLTTMTDASGATKYFYDNMGRPTTVKKTVDGKTYAIETAYDNGRLASITYPDEIVQGVTVPGETVYYQYDATALQSVCTTANCNGSGNYMYAYYQNYNALGQPGTVTNPNGVTTTYQYYPDNNRLWKITAGAGALLDLTYEYFPGGNIKSITDPNRPSVLSPGTEVTYSHTGTRPHAVTATTDGYSLEYDNNGNMKSDGFRTIDYDYDNMPTSITYGGYTTTFTYDGNGARVKKTSSNGTNIYIGKLYECNAVGCTKYIFAGGTRIAAKSGDEVLYYHQDHLGSTRVVTEDVVGADLRRLSYYPFGETQSITGPEFTVSHQYTSQEFDDTTGLYYYNARYYNPSLGRFISPDTIIPDPTNPQAFNRYSYVLNNPLRYTDPSGHSWHTREWRTFGKSVAVGAVGGAVFVFSGGTAAPIMAGMYAGAAAGATGAALSGGGAKEIAMGAVMGGVMGAAGGALYTVGGAYASYGMLAGGAGYSYAKGGTTGLAYFAGGVMGGMAGAYAASYAQQNWFATQEEPIQVAKHVYDQSSGDMVHVDDQTGVATYEGRGYSGQGDGLNNPAKQNVRDVGPIPQGEYEIGPVTERRGPVTVNLEPRPDTNTFGRDNFRIHGDNNLGNQSASQGCIILPRDTRIQIINSNDPVLEVVP